MSLAQSFPQKTLSLLIWQIGGWAIWRQQVGQFWVGTNTTDPTFGCFDAGDDQHLIQGLQGKFVMAGTKTPIPGRIKPQLESLVTKPLTTRCQSARSDLIFYST
ncbi:hypothetical protein OLM90_27930 [Pseudomonas aeruginosa]|uniref:hypothetical protein n=1 Tax=Pseudomonas TaxID=286 RepID=UPI0013924086|nr:MULTISPECIES: hypothetical protein [Pseudomonas]ELP1404999.1 hypothetical protein [Pseudomonas aeruginosa]MBG7070550.1 hypothetical protein [Pseudomonas aeruginosa]MBG7282410.1 hypothetical protein [Pseudomonas aeruginosa]MBH4497078.1 hypothetical protein [Pseudomonas aeruginosa]MBX6946338.1 hypothetical protein [Pseudomonas aeruginosa]